MNGWAVFFLGVIAVATLATAILQVALMLYAGRLARRITSLVSDLEGELKPLFASANAVGRDAARVASLAVSQMERADQMFANVAAKVDETVAIVQRTMIAPAREGMALLAGLRAALAAFRGLRGPAQEKRAEEEETLFI
jgi:uncharacterized protein (DUF1501 family)